MSYRAQLWADDQVCFWWYLKLDTQKSHWIGIRSCGRSFKSVSFLSTSYCSRNFLLWNCSLSSFYHRRLTSSTLCRPPKSHESPLWGQNTRLCLSETHNTCCDEGPLTGDSYHEPIYFTFLSCWRQSLSLQMFNALNCHTKELW